MKNMFKLCKEHRPNQAGKYRAKGQHMPFLTQQMQSLSRLTLIKHLKTTILSCFTRSILSYNNDNTSRFRVNNEVLFPQLIAAKSITQPNMRLLWHKNYGEIKENSHISNTFKVI